MYIGSGRRVMEETFGKRLKRIRCQRDYTQEQLARISDISVQTIRNYEQDLCEPISKYLLYLAKALNVTAEYLLLGDNNMSSYTDAIKVELMQLADYDKISEIKNENFNSTVLSHLEMSDELVSSIKKDWNGKNIFKCRKNVDGKIVIKDSYCIRTYVQEVIIKYCQNREKYLKKFKLQDGMILNSES